MRQLEVLVDSVSFVFGDRVVLDDFSTVLHPGQVGALVGPSGSGKSTLLNAVGGLVTPRAGSVTLRRVDDGTVTGPSPELVAWVPQGANCLGARSALDNVMLGPLSGGQPLPVARRTAYDALGRVGLADRASSPARTLSGGELQRVSFARALASSKPIILADEPTSSLDAASTEVVAALLHSLSVDATVVVATHDPLLIEAATYAVDIRRRSRAA